MELRSGTSNGCSFNLMPLTYGGLFCDAVTQNSRQINTGEACRRARGGHLQRSSAGAARDIGRALLQTGLGDLGACDVTGSGCSAELHHSGSVGRPPALASSCQPERRGIVSYTGFAFQVMVLSPSERICTGYLRSGWAPAFSTRTGILCPWCRWAKTYNKTRS